MRERHSLDRLQGQGHQPIDQRPIIGPVELPQFKPIEELLQEFAPGLIAPCVQSPDRRRHLQLRGDDAEQWRERRLVLRKYPAPVTSVDHLDRQAQAIVIVAVLANVGEREQLNTFRRRQQFVSRHRNPSRETEFLRKSASRKYFLIAYF